MTSPTPTLASRPAPTWRSIVITGASGGIGQALAAELSAPGVRIALVGRDAARLEVAAGLCRAQGAEVVLAAIDVRDAAAMAEFLAGFDADGPVELLIANAGVTTGLGPGRSPEPRGQSRRLLEINYAGVLHTVEPLLGAMQARRGGHIVLVSSLAGIRALPDMPSYSASKAAVRAYGIALRGWLRPFGVTVSVVCPGFVTSPMSARHRGARPFEIGADVAARKIVRGLRARRASIAFPWPLLLGMRLGALLPPVLSDWFMRPFAAEIEPDAESRET